MWEEAQKMRPDFVTGQLWAVPLAVASTPFGVARDDQTVDHVSDRWTRRGRSRVVNGAINTRARYTKVRSARRGRATRRTEPSASTFATGSSGGQFVSMGTSDTVDAPPRPASTPQNEQGPRTS